MTYHKISDRERTVNIPLDHLIAEMIAFPLASVSAFKNRIADLSPGMSGGTGKLWRDAEHQIIQTNPDLSIDQAVAIRDRLWFDQIPNHPPVRLHDFLSRMAYKFLEVHGSVAIPRSVPREGSRECEDDIMDMCRRNKSMRWLSFSLPTDLLQGGLCIGHQVPAEIHHLPPQLLTRLRDHGFSEVHLHIWASLQFPILWVTTLHSLASTEIKEDSFTSPGAEFNEGRDLGLWLLRTAIARYLLALFLCELKVSSMNLTFSEYLNLVLSKIGKSQGVVAQELLRTSVKELLAGAFLHASPPYANLRSIYRNLAKTTIINGLPDDPENVFFADPIAHLVSYRFPKQPSPEILFIHQGISYLTKHASNHDSFFETLFWQVIRLRGIFYRHIVQRPMTPGLQWFIRTYSRISPGRKTVGWKFLIRTAAKTCGKGKGLRSLEVRTSPDTSFSEILKIVKQFLKGLKKEDITDEFEFGIVFHFAKLRGGGAEKGLPAALGFKTEADPFILGAKNQIHEARSRYSRYYREKKNEALSLARLIFNFPKVLKVIRGIDICTDETGIPTWVLVPHLRYVRDAGNAASRYLRHVLNQDVPELRVTIHCGEDFVHLLGGMRRIEEALTYYKLRPGDRLGHAIALGTDPAAWAERAGYVAMPREERLVWEWMHYSSDKVAWTGGRLAFIEREIARLTELIFGEKLTPFEMETFICNLHDENLLSHIGYPDFSMIKYDNYSDKLLKQLMRYLIDPDVFNKGQAIEWVNTATESGAMKSLQNYLRQLIANVGLVVEMNPSSNLLIGNLTDLKNHPMWRLNPPGRIENTVPVSVCIGSDDPVTFATSLPQEYALLHESLISGGLSASEAYAWLEQVRETGMSSRFTCFRPSEIGELCSHHAFGLDRDVRPMP